MTRTLYDILEVAPSASQETIQAAYRSLINRYHPDRVAGLGAELQDIAAARAKELNRAYEALKDPARRAAYDDGLRRGATAAESRHGHSFKKMEEFFRHSREKISVFEKKYTVLFLSMLIIPTFIFGKFAADLLLDPIFSLTCTSNTNVLKQALRESASLLRNVDFDLDKIVTIGKNPGNGELMCSAVAYGNGKYILKVTYTKVNTENSSTYSKIMDIDYF